MEITDFYLIDEGRLKEILERYNPRKILVQLPEGLKHFYPSILTHIKNLLSRRNVIIDLDASPIFGSCLMDTSITSHYDIVLHFGHEEYPYWKAPKNIFFIKLISKNNISDDTLNRFIKFALDHHLIKLALYGTAQHPLESIGERLVDAGLEIVNDIKRGTIFGCWFSDLIETVKMADGVIVVSGGDFHPLGVGLYLNNSKPIISLDPYTDTFRHFNNLVYGVLKKRYYKILKASEAHAWMILAGVQGQFRPAIVEKLKQEIEERGDEYFIAHSAYVTRETLGNIDNNKIDAFIITSCPRLPIDDLSDFYKPVLTPGEAFMVFNNILQRYLYPW